MVVSTTLRTAIAIAVQLPRDCQSEVQRSLDELTRLLAGLSIEVVQTLVQKRAHASAASWLGEGKLRELAELAAGARVDCAVADAELSPGQQRSLERFKLRRVHAALLSIPPRRPG